MRDQRGAVDLTECARTQPATRGARRARGGQRGGVSPSWCMLGPMSSGRPRVPASAVAAAAVVTTMVLCLFGAATGSGTAAAFASAADGYPDGLQVSPGHLSAGSATTALHLENTTVVDGTRRVSTGLSGRVSLVGRARSGYVVLTVSLNGADRTLWRVRTDGSLVRLRRLGADSLDGGLPVVSADGRRVAYLAPSATSTRAAVLRVRDGALLGAHRFRGLAEILDFRRRLLLTTATPARTFYYDAASDGVAVTLDRTLTWADVAHDRAIVQVPDPAGPHGVCIDWTRLSAPDLVIWHSCTDIPIALSPSGARLVATYLTVDGPGPTLVQLRESETGNVLLTLRTTGYFGLVHWESDSSLLLDTWRNGREAIVRVRLDGSLERVSALVRNPQGIDVLRWSFPTR